MFKNFLKLPTPKELGWSSDNALPMRDLSSNNSRLCWEDWQEVMRKEYPVRYFLTETLAFWFITKIKRPIQDFWYYIRCHFLPGNQYHILDLRQPLPGYQYGWLDADTKMTYALFNILDQFMTHEFDRLYCPTDQEIQQNPWLQEQKDICLEIQDIHNWWKNSSPSEKQSKEDEMVNRLIKIRHCLWT